VAVWRLRRSYPHVAKVIKYSIPAFLTRAPNIAINIEVLRRFPILLKIKKNSEIYTWTVNSDEDMLWIQDKRISGVITDNVGKAKTLKP
jgi:glycerophosphoryl diester phosphodiesterase